MLRIENDHVLRRELEFEVENDERKERLKRTEKNQMEEKCMMVRLSKEYVLC